MMNQNELQLAKRLDDIQGRTVPGHNTVSLLHFARDFNNHINTHGLYWETWSARNGNDNMVDIIELEGEINNDEVIPIGDDEESMQVNELRRSSLNRNPVS